MLTEQEIARRRKILQESANKYHKKGVHPFCANCKVYHCFCKCVKICPKCNKKMSMHTEEEYGKIV